MTAFGSILIFPSQPSLFFMISASVRDVGCLEVGGGNRDCGELLAFLSGDDRQSGILEEKKEIQGDGFERTKR